LLSGGAGLGVGFLLAGWWQDRRSEKVDEHGLPVAELDLGDAEGLAAQAADGPVFHPAGRGRIAVLRWEPDHASPRGDVLERYGPDGEDHPILTDGVGLMVVALASPHCGCLVAWCDTSRWFEGPCHGSRFNRWGEWTGGPAPRGLDRYRSRVDPDGRLVASLTRQIVGMHRESGLLEQSPEGPACV
jgi:cytochrome b6-f complex iron-sulfur subunit